MSNTIITFERAFVKFSDDLAVDGYRSPSGEFRVGMASASVVLGYEKDWLSRAVRREGTTLEWYLVWVSQAFSTKEKS